MYRISTYYVVCSIQPFQVYFVNTFPHLRPNNFWTIRFSSTFVLRERHTMYKLVCVLYRTRVFSHSSVSNNWYHVAVRTVLRRLTVHHAVKQHNFSHVCYCLNEQRRCPIPRPCGELGNGGSMAFVILIRRSIFWSFTKHEKWVILYNDQQMHNYFTNYHTLHVSTLSCQRQGVRS